MVLEIFKFVKNVYASYCDFVGPNWTTFGAIGTVCVLVLVGALCTKNPHKDEDNVMVFVLGLAGVWALPIIVVLAVVISAIMVPVGMGAGMVKISDVLQNRVNSKNIPKAIVSKT